MPRDPLRVMAYPAFSVRERQPYNYLLCSALAQRGAQIEEFSRLRLLLERFDVVHFHFPEYVLYKRPRRKALRLSLTVLALLTWARLRGAKLVWTVHNIEAHELLYPRLSSLYWMAYTRQVDGFISLSKVGAGKVVERFGHLRARPHAVIPHGHFKDEYPRDVDRDEARRHLGIDVGFTAYLFFGQVRPYKGVPELLAAFAGVDDPDAVLIIAGMPLDDTMRQELAERSERDPRVKLHLRFVPVEEAQLYFTAADLVVLPYRQILNSGSALLALSFDRPVLVPDTGALGELQSQLGPRWVQTYTGRVDAKTLEDAVRATRDRPAAADLSAFDWDGIGAETLDFYRSLTAGRQGNK